MVRTTPQTFARHWLIAPLVTLAMLSGCQTTEGHGDDSSPSQGAAIVKTMDAGGYTYVQLDTPGGKAWYAVPECKVAIGDRVEVADGAMKMHNFESRTLKRTFPVIYFASELVPVE